MARRIGVLGAVRTRAGVGTRATLTDAELAKRNADIDEQRAFVMANYWPELGHTPPLASLIVEPENGRLPPMIRRVAFPPTWRPAPQA